MILLPKKEGGKLIDYFRFLSAQKLTIPIMTATATAAIMAISVVASGASVAAIGSADAGEGATGSGSIDCAADVASPTFM